MRVFAIAAVAALCIVSFLLHNEIKDFLFIHPWWQSFIAAIPVIAVPVLAFRELQHSEEANKLRTQANDLRARANTLQEEQNQSVAKNTEPGAQRSGFPSLSTEMGALSFAPLVLAKGGIPVPYPSNNTREDKRGPETLICRRRQSPDRPQSSPALRDG